MPGIKRAELDAELSALRGSVRVGSEGLQNAYWKAQWRYDDAPVHRTGSLNRNLYPEYPVPRSVPAAYPESPSDDDQDAETPVHEGFENRMTPPLQSRALSFEESGLPPTPPTLNNSDVSREQNEEESVSPPAIFADGVRNALESKKSGLSATPVNAVSPPTPDPSPPATTDDLPAMEQKEKPQFLHPMIADSAASHLLREYPSSRADLFQTAHEDQPQSPESSIKSPVHLPDDDRLPQHWLDSSHELRLATIGLGDITVAETPKENEVESEARSITPKSPRRRSKHESPPQTAREDSDWEKHISYVSGPDELDGYLASEEDAKVKESPEETTTETEKEPAPVYTEESTKRSADERVQEAPRGLGLSGAGLQQHELERSAEDVNNMVYRRIQEENVKRHSVVSSTPGAITVGIIIPAADSTPKTLKRQTKCLSLRGDASSDSKRGSVDSTEKNQIGQRKVRGPVESSKKLEASPVLESSIRQVSSPARLGPDTSDMTALTYASMQDSPSAKKSRISRFQPETEHKLRHFSYGDRLANNMSVRRTSLHGSPSAPANAFEIFREPEYPARRVSNTEKPGRDKAMMNNVGIKRSSTEGAKPSRVLEKPRGVIPSVTSDTPEDMLERSPTTGRLRRFSREERLENNDSVRRTSLDHEKTAKLIAESVEKGFQTNRGDLPSPPENTTAPSSPEKTRRTSSQDRGIVPPSPRKSLDARYLHPTTTPMSVSQFSDRTEVELCEASGVRIYPHNNDSLLVVQHGSRPTSKDKTMKRDGYETTEELRSLGQPVFAAQVDPPTPTLGATEPATNVDSPLTNPRTAPEPPVFKFIPPTPNEELDRELTGNEKEGSALRAEDNRPPKSLSLMQRARRYSDSLFMRTGSLRRPRHANEERAVFLSPLWRPQGFWDDFDSEEEDDYEPAGALPKGGDTSNIGEDGRKRTGIFPRAMSKRLPGFRGQGGFLVGNSLGLDRHGTNNRRHYVSTGTRTLSKRQSEELLKSLASSAPRASQDSLRKIAKARTFAVPFSGGMRAQWVGTQRFREKMRAIQLAREERAAEKRRERLKGQIGGRVLNGDMSVTA